MTSALLYAFAGVALCGIGLFGFLRLQHLLRKLMAFNLIGSGVFLIMVGLAQRNGQPDPVPRPWCSRALWWLLQRRHWLWC